jgi:hypothetical protein
MAKVCPANSGIKTKQKTLALVMAGLVLVAFTAFAYHSTLYCPGSITMWARCPVCALAGQGTAAFDHPEIQYDFGFIAIPLISEPFFLPQKPQIRFRTVRGPPVLSITV